MTDTRILLDPTARRDSIAIEVAPRIDGVSGLTVGLLDITKPRGDVFLNRLEQRLTEQGATVRRYAKPTFARTAPVDLRHEIAEHCEVVIEALAD